MRTLKRQCKFTKISERKFVQRYWSCDICFKFFLCLVTHDPPLKFVRSMHSGTVKGEMSNTFVLTEVFGEQAFNRVLPQFGEQAFNTVLPSTTHALYVLFTFSNFLDIKYSILSCKCMSSQICLQNKSRQQ